ncbi:hypothetical protein AB9R84_07635 [Oceanimonas smirnovii]|uniref:hypothetical protein n=1 Tax=Oceanimonas smirnovii TaxID=264574 RepID=UPI003AAD1724
MNTKRKRFERNAKGKKSEHYPEQKPGIPLLPNINMHFASAFFFCLLQGRWLTTFFIMAVWLSAWADVMTAGQLNFL